MPIFHIEHDRLHPVIAVEDEIHLAVFFVEGIVCVQDLLILHHYYRAWIMLDYLQVVYEIENELLVVQGSRPRIRIEFFAKLHGFRFFFPVLLDDVQPEVEKLR